MVSAFSREELSHDFEPNNGVNLMFYLNISIRQYLIYNNTRINIEQQRYSSGMLEGGGLFFTIKIEHFPV